MTDAFTVYTWNYIHQTYVSSILFDIALKILKPAPSSSVLGMLWSCLPNFMRHIFLLCEAGLLAPRLRRFRLFAAFEMENNMKWRIFEAKRQLRFIFGCQAPVLSHLPRDQQVQNLRTWNNRKQKSTSFKPMQQNNQTQCDLRLSDTEMKNCWQVCVPA